MKPEVPVDWAVERLGIVAEVILSNVDKKSSSRELPVRLCNYMDVYANARITADLPFMEATATPAEIERFGLRVGDVLITKDSEDPSDIAVPSVVADEFDGPVVCGYHLAILRPRREVDGPYLSWALRSRPVNDQFTRKANGSTRFGLTNDVIRSAWIALPPLAEQRKIAAVLSSVDDAIAATRKIIEQTNRVKQGLLQTLMTRGIGHTRFKKTEIGDIPESWEVVTLGDLGRWTSGGTPSKARSEYWGGGVPWVTPKDMKVSHIRSSVDTITNAAIAAGARLLPQGALLVVVRGMILAHTFPVAVTMVPVAINQDMKALVPSDRVNSSYVLAWLQLSEGAMLARISEATHGTKRLTQPDLLSFPIPLPPRPEQDRIVSVLSTVLDSADVEHRRLHVLQRVKTGLMQDLLTGRVRVQPD